MFGCSAGEIRGIGRVLGFGVCGLVEGLGLRVAGKGNNS